ncbi:MAG: DUF2914 domain-containing protein [Syntrophobacterales bacterium]|nr:DUF2914 domain-containing protein [Syntrophobacterales bacterium]
METKACFLQGLKIFLIGLSLIYSFIAFAQTGDEAPQQIQETTSEDNLPFMKTGLICESVRNGHCERPTVVLSVERKQAFCYTLFENITAPRIIYHRWYHRGELTTQIRLRLQPPRWATYSSIQLREADKGPWQVEVVDETGRVYGVLRFSITE